MQKHLEILAATGVNYIYKYLYELPLGIFISQNFYLPYFNKYCMDFNALWSKNIGYHQLEQQSVKVY